MRNMHPLRPKKIADSIISTFDVRTCQSLDVCIEKALSKTRPKLSTLRLADVITAIRGQTKLHINRYISECGQRKIPPRISWSTSDPERLIGRCFISGQDTPKEISEKQRARFLGEIWETIAGQLTPDQFVTLCFQFLKAEGFDSIRITGRSHDGGIDLRATYTPEISLGQSLDAACQVKRYGKDRRIGVSLIRDFFGAIKSAGEDIDIAFFFTTATYSREAKEFARKNRIWIADGEQMSFWLVKLNAGFIEESGQTSFSQPKLVEWLSS